MKKKIALLMILVMITALVGCGKKDNATSNETTSTETVATETTTSSETTTETATTETEDNAPTEKYTIAVAWNAIDSSTQTRMKYLQEYIGPAIGVDFIFSEAISDIDSLMTFLENAYAAGADGLLSTVTDGTEQLVSRANELGIYTAVVSSKLYDSVAEVPTYMGITGIDITKVAGAYGYILNEQFSKDQPANFIIVSGGSAMGVASHREATQSMLITLQEKYGLTYEMTVPELAAINATSDIATGNEEVKITIVPGFPNMDGYVSGVSGLLQTGEYDAIISVYPTAEVFSTAIDEVEKALGKNIKMICQANFGENTKFAFETLDSTGNPTLDGAVLYAATASDAYALVLLYNGITGNSDVVKPEGKAVVFAPGPLVAADAKEYEKLAMIDTADEFYVYSIDEVKSMLKAFNPDVTYDSIMQNAVVFSTSDILQRRLLDSQN